MASRTPDWSELASENERFLTDGGASGERLVPASLWQASAEQVASAAQAAAAPAPGPPRRPRWRIRTARGTPVGTAAALAVTTAALAVTAAALAVTTAASASASASPAVPPLAWHLVKQVHQGDNGEFTAIAAVGTNGGWAFSGDGFAAPTAFRRSGATWTQAPFPGRSDERVLAAQATSAADVWAFTTNGTASRALRWNGSRWSVAGSFSREISGATVISSTNVWVFGDGFQPGGVLGTWHFNGHIWTHVPGEGGLHGGSALSAASIWAFGGTKVAHWNGHAWTATSVASLLPARDPNGLNDPGVSAIYAQSPTSVWAVGDGGREDEGGPVVILHFNGHGWRQVAADGAFAGDSVFGQVAPDGRGGLWIPVPGSEGGPSRLLHYSDGHLTAAVLPVAANRIAVESVAWIPGTFQALAGGLTHAPNNFGAGDVAVILQFKR
jgi:hypothetical protein